jgi:hypothetical protein
MIFCVFCDCKIRIVHTNQNVDYGCQCRIISGPPSSENKKIAYLKVIDKIKDGWKWTSQGYYKEGIFESTGTKYDVKGYDIEGNNEGGYNEEGINRYGNIQANKINDPKVARTVSRSKYPLYHMSTIENLQSILSTGILSHDLSMQKNPTKISNPEIVKKRGKIILSSGNSLNHYANFYFIPSNAMLYKRLFVCQHCDELIESHGAEKLTECIARIQVTHGSRIIPENIIVFEINLYFNHDDVFVSDGNCAVDHTKIEPMPAHDLFETIDDTKTKSGWYRDKELQRRFQAECLIPEKVEVSSIRAIHVQNDMIQEKINDIIKEKFPNLRNTVVKKNPPMFFS